MNIMAQIGVARVRVGLVRVVRVRVAVVVRPAVVVGVA
jgi:hypothetical protein